MGTRRVTRVVVVLMVALIGVALLGVVAGAAAAEGSGGGAVRWAALDSGGPTPNDIAGPDDDPVVSFAEAGTLGPDCRNGEDIHYGVGDAVLHWAARGCWLPWFDAEGSGLPASADINALHDECGPTEPRCDIYLSFTRALRVPGLAGKIQPHDVVGAAWVAGTQDVYDNFWVAFDGSDVGLSEASERLDALFLFDESQPAQFDHCAALGWFSTVGNYRVRDEWGGWLIGGGEDILGFCASSTGDNTAGYWFLYHDGSAEGLPRHALNGLAHEDNRTAYGRFNFLTKRAISVENANGDAGDVFEYSTYNGDMYRGPLLRFWEATGAAGVPDSIHIYYLD